MSDLKALVAQMTVEEKVGQLIQLSSDFFGTGAELTGPAQQRGLTDEQLATIGSCIGGKNATVLREIQDKHLATDRNKIPLLFARDVIHGYRTIYPIGLAMAGSFDPALVTECTEMAAKEAAAGGTHVTYAPMVDLSRDARWGRVMESCGEDPFLASVMGAAQVKAFQGDNIADHDRVAACVKHFAAYGGGEAGRDYNTVEISERTLRQFFLPSYRACIEAGVKMLMPSFNNLNGIPSTANPFLMKKILREEWGFTGTVISDWAAVYELAVQGVAENKKEAARMAFENGCHIEMLSNTYEQNLAELVREGTIDEAALDEAVLNVLRFKEELGLFEDPYHGGDDEKGEAMFLSDAHRAIARKAAEESAVLLKNDGVLPFSDKVRRVAIIGPYAEDKNLRGPWSALGTEAETVSVREGVSALLPNAEIVTTKGCGYLYTDLDKDGFAEAVALAKEADAVILCVGEPLKYSGEGNCRTDIRLPGVQAELVQEVMAVNKNAAVVLFNGRPLALTDIYDAPAILEMWFPGTEGGSAAANLLFGKANPCGKLAMSFPKAVGQCPLYYNRTNTGRPKTVADDRHQAFVSNYIDCGNLPLFFFGEGHSYTTFTYESMTLDRQQIGVDDTLTVKVTVKNSGDRAGKEAVQLYMRDMVSSAVRPVQELIAFEKVSLLPGESKTVTFTVCEPMLRFWNAENKYLSEAGEFKLFVGYADHALLTDSFRLTEGRE